MPGPALSQISTTVSPTTPQKADTLPQACKFIPHPFELDCWLNHYTNVANSITWQKYIPVGGAPEFLKWTDWTPQMKTDLRTHYAALVAWYNNGLGTYTGPQLPDPIPNITLPDEGPNGLALSPDQAWNLYLSYVAFSLAAEIKGWVNWSVVDYEHLELVRLFSSVQMLHMHLPVGPFAQYTGYVKQDVTPSHPTYLFSFFKQNDLIRSTPEATVGRLLEWMKGAHHIMGGWNITNYEYYYQYRGPPPTRRIIEGTVMTDPAYPVTFPNPEHWIAGCGGSTKFIAWVLRVVNLPTEEQGICGHITPHFLTIDRYLSHGDDPYSIFSSSSPGEDLLVTETDFNQWFSNILQAGSYWLSRYQYECKNVGRRPKDLSLKTLPPALVQKFCIDQKQGKGHVDGKVFEVYDDLYSLDELENLSLWRKLSEKAASIAQCGGDSCQCGGDS